MTDGFKKSVLDNGIRVLSEKMEGTRAVSLGIWIEAGSRFDPYSQTGTAHFLEHILFKGTENRSAFEIAKSLEMLGGYLNAFTEKELTAYYAQVLDKDLAVAVDVLSDVIQYPVLDSVDIQNERQIVLEEIQNLQDSPEEYIQDLFLQLVFQNHALGESILGTTDSVPRIDQAALIQFKKNYYTGNRIVVACAGNVEHSYLVDLINNTFCKMECGTEPDINQPFGEPAVFDERFEQFVSQVHFCTGTRGIPYSDPRRYSLICLNTLIGGCMSSRLFQKLRENQGLAYAVYSMLDFWSDSGLWGVYAGTSPPQKDMLTGSIYDELGDIQQGQITLDELKRTQSQLIGNLILSMEDTSSRMDRLARMELNSKSYLDVDTVANRLRNVTLEDLTDTASWLLEQPFFTTMIEPQNPAGRGNS